MKKILLAVAVVAAFALTGCDNKEHCYKVTVKCNIDGDRYEYVAYGWGTKDEVAAAQDETSDDEDCTFTYKRVSGGILSCAAKEAKEAEKQWNED